MSSPITQCTSCGSSSLSPLGPSYAHASLVQCRGCALVFAAQRPSTEELIAHYKQYNRGFSISPLTVFRYNQLLDGMEAFRRSGKILDVGCGDGHFLEVAKNRGWQVTGTEFDPVAVELCRKKGITIFSGALASLPLEGDFDVITSFEVIEHIHNGVEDVQRIQALLRPGGLFYFTTPNFNSLSRRCLKGEWGVIAYPEHLTYYTRKTMHRLLTQHGLVKQKIKTTGISLQKFSANAEATSSGDANLDEQVRSRIEKSGLLRTLKQVVNELLSLFALGDTIKGWYIKKA